MSDLYLCPVTFDEAVDFVGCHHRHHPAPTGHKFSIGVARGGEIVGVAMVGRPVARLFDDGWTLEVNRTCTKGLPAMLIRCFMAPRGALPRRWAIGD
ncbi:hypothetical protein I553_10704 [Mycobacterium xenopi 4042]|uniref:Uncharacterized protein n=1 Tax=Mycobacterium xenopi 4042 TaxID=1299334 RepID=X8D9W3_MYCXE|nr:hypothetical protein I553_10704 [Mycobacterium xenopi 4042]